MGRLRATAAVALVAAALFPSCRPAAPPASAVLSVPYEIATLDPHAKNNLHHFALVSNFYEPLVTTDADMKIRPGLARTWENPDSSTWIFHLQPGARFHSGRPLRAADVAYSIRRLLADQGLEIAGYVHYVAEVQALDDRTVRLRTTRPLSVFLNKLRFVSIVPEGARGEDLALRPDGTGPYLLAEWQRGERLRLSRNPAYWGPAPSLQEVTFLLDRSPEEAAADLESGRAQLAQCNSRAPQRRLRAAGRFRILSRPSLFTKYLGYDLAREVTPYVSVKPNPFRNRAVRRALHLALDRGRLAGGLSTEAVPATQLVPSSIFGFNPTLAPPGHEPEEARALLARAGLRGGFRSTLHVRKLLAEAAFLVRDQLRPVGIDLEVVVLPDTEFLDLLHQGGSSMHLSRFGCPTGDASDILDNTLHTYDPLRHMGMQNYGRYSNPEVDREIEESAGVESVTERRALLERIMARLMEDLAWIPLYVDEDVYAFAPRLVWQPRNDSFILAAEIGAAPP